MERKNYSGLSSTITNYSGLALRARPGAAGARPQEGRARAPSRQRREAAV